MIRFNSQMTLDEVKDFLEAHPEWSPALRLTSIATCNFDLVRVVGLFGPGGMLFSLESVATALIHSKGAQ